ncbi:MAG: hypothetical protein M0013_12905, partial [Actinomycetota bacterium]|nr:hypothetical protein [Actinomycetota bacterium]
CEAAWRDGDITGAHVAVVAALRRDETAPSLVRDEEMLVDQARTLRFDAFRRVVGYWEQLADPDGADRDGERERSRVGRRVDWPPLTPPRTPMVIMSW